MTDGHRITRDVDTRVVSPLQDTQADMVKHLHGGFVLSAIVKALQQTPDLAWRTELRNLCAFVLTSNFLPAPSMTHPLHAVLGNILTRGLPTLASVAIEDHLTQAFDSATRCDSAQTGEITYDLKPEKRAWLDLMARSLAIVDPHLSPADRLLPSYRRDVGFSDHGPEGEFLYTVLPDLVGDFACQLIEPQRPLTSLLPRDGLSNAQMRDLVSTFTKQRVDFVFDFPKAQGYRHRLVIEIDDATHTDSGQRQLDDRRDTFLWEHCQAKVLRIPVANVRKHKLLQKDEKLIKEMLTHPYAQRSKANYDAPLYERPQGLAAMQLVLAPLAMARIQLTLLDALETGALALDVEEWRLAVIERDVPCAFLAVWDWLQLVRHLRSLAGDGDTPLPRIRLRIYPTPAFAAALRVDGVQGEEYGDEHAPHDPHLLLDQVEVYGRHTRPMTPICS